MRQLFVAAFCVARSLNYPGVIIIVEERAGQRDAARCSARAPTRPQIGQIERSSYPSSLPPLSTSPSTPFISLFRSTPLRLFSPSLSSFSSQRNSACTLSLLLPSSRVFVVRYSKGYIARRKWRSQRCRLFHAEKTFAKIPALYRGCSVSSFVRLISPAQFSTIALTFSPSFPRDLANG